VGERRQLRLEGYYFTLLRVVGVVPVVVVVVQGRWGGVSVEGGGGLFFVYDVVVSPPGGWWWWCGVTTVRDAVGGCGTSPYSGRGCHPHPIAIIVPASVSTVVVDVVRRGRWWKRWWRLWSVLMIGWNTIIITVFFQEITEPSTRRRGWSRWWQRLLWVR